MNVIIIFIYDHDRLPYNSILFGLMKSKHLLPRLLYLQNNNFKLGSKNDRIVNDNGYVRLFLRSLKISVPHVLIRPLLFKFVFVYK